MPERQHDRDDRADAERQREPEPPGAHEQDEPREREDRRQPAEEDEALRPVAAVAGDEIEPGRGVVRNLLERAAAGADRARDVELGHEQRGAGRRRDRCERACDQPRAPRAAERVDEEERHRAEREVQVLERNRGDRRAGGHQPPPRAAARPLEGPERERQQHRDRPAQMAGALRHPVRRERERQPADERRARRQQELSQPEVREASGREVRQQHQQVPRDDRPEARRRAARTEARTASRRS